MKPQPLIRDPEPPSPYSEEEKARYIDQEKLKQSKAIKEKAVKEQQTIKK